MSKLLILLISMTAASSQLNAFELTVDSALEPIMSADHDGQIYNTRLGLARSFSIGDQLSTPIYAGLQKSEIYSDYSTTSPVLLTGSYLGVNIGTGIQWQLNSDIQPFALLNFGMGKADIEVQDSASSVYRNYSSTNNIAYDLQSTIGARFNFAESVKLSTFISAHQQTIEIESSATMNDGESLNGNTLNLSAPDADYENALPNSPLKLWTLGLGLGVHFIF